MLHLCMGCGVGVISNSKISLVISECPKVSVYNQLNAGPLFLAHLLIMMMIRLMLVNRFDLKFS